MRRKAIVTHTRPNPSVKFYKVPKQDEADWDALFASGALISKEIVMTPLTITYINTWRSRADADAFGQVAKSKSRHRGVDEYNSANGITKTLTFEDVPE